jgi:hypothetical protein
MHSNINKRLSVSAEPQIVFINLAKNVITSANSRVIYIYIVSKIQKVSVFGNYLCLSR